MTARLPIPGSDDGDWGDILNTYLEVAHNNDGTLKQLSLPLATNSEPGAIQITGDLSGSAISPIVIGVDGVPVVVTNPNDGDVLTYVSSSSKIENKPAQIGTTVQSLGGPGIATRGDELTTLDSSGNPRVILDDGLGNIIAKNNVKADNALAVFNIPNQTDVFYANQNGEVATQNASGNLRNALDDGFGNAIIAGSLTTTKNTLDDGSGNTTITGILSVNGKSIVNGALVPIIVEADTQAAVGQLVYVIGTATITPPTNPSLGDEFGVTASGLGAVTVAVGGLEGDLTLAIGTTTLLAYLAVEGYGFFWVPILPPPPALPTTQLQTYEFWVSFNAFVGASCSVTISGTGGGTPSAVSGVPLTINPGDSVASPAVNSPAFSSGSVGLGPMLLTVSNALGTEKLVLQLTGPISIGSSTYLAIDFGESPDIMQQVGVDLYWNEPSLSIKTTGGGDYFVRFSVQILTDNLVT